MTGNQLWLSKKYIIYKVLTSMWFVSAVWLYFYRIFITDQQVGILDGLAFAIGLLAEVPSGALADKIGRDKVVRLGQILAGCGILIQAAGSSFLPFFIGQAVLMIGISFVSGADDALFFERLQFKHTSLEWRKLVTRGSQAGLFASIIVTITGGILHAVNPRLPWVLTGITFIAAALFIWPIKDTRPKKTRQLFLKELKEYLNDINIGFQQFRLPKLWVYVPLILTLQGLFYTYSYGLLRLILLDRFNFTPFWGAVIVASCSLITIGLLSYMHYIAHTLSEKKIVISIGLMAALSLLMSLANIGWWGYFVILALHTSDYILIPFMSEVLNNHAPVEQRATVLSVASFLKTLPYVILAPLIGYLSTHDTLEYFLIIWTMLIILSILIYLLTLKNDKKISLAD